MTDYEFIRRVMELKKKHFDLRLPPPTPAEIQALRGTVETNGAAPMDEKSFPNVTSWSHGGPVSQKILCNSQGPDFLKAVVDRLLEERDAGYNHDR